MKRFLALLALVAAFFASAANPAGAAPHPAQGDLEHWADAMLARDIARHRASGMAIAVVSGGRVSYLNGYGAAGVGDKARVDPSRTLFSLGSITKLFTATAIAQLLERGRIHSLDDPANRYLHRFQLPRAFGRDITIRNLLDYRGGFDESVFGLATVRDVTVPISGQDILKRLPEIVRAPGEISVYSNAGYGVLGMLVEDVSGLTYRDYIRQNILKPLGMTKSYIRYSPSEPIATPGTAAPDGSLSPISQKWAYHPFIAPSAALVSTAEDMGKFMLGQLEAEHGAQTNLIGAAGAHLLHDRGNANAAATTGFGMSFFAHSWNGERVAENAGSGPGFQATLILLPDSDVGFLVMIMGNSAADGNSLDMFEVREKFLNYYLGPLHPKAGPRSGLPMSAFAGLYRNERRPHATVEAVMNTGTSLPVEAGGPDTLTIDGRPGEREVAAGVFWKPGVIPFVPEEASSDLYAFPIENGRVTGAVPYLGRDIYRPALLAPETVLYLIAGLLVLCATGLGAFFWRAATPVERWTRRAAVSIGVLAIAVPASLIAGFMIVGNPYLSFGFGDVTLYIVTATFSNLLALLAVVFLPLTILCVIRTGAPRSGMPLARNLHYGAILLAGLGLIPLFGYFNFLGYRIP